MEIDGTTFVPLVMLGVLTMLVVIGWRRGDRGDLPGALSHLWAFFVVFNVAAWVSVTAALWLMAAISFRALREYLSLVDLRLEDRWGILGAYLSIPFMTYLIQINWYGFFIISIPVYTFLVVPFLVALGGRRSRGSVLSIGAIDFGLFLLVYCLGHIGYLMLFSIWKAIFLVASVAISDGSARLLHARGGMVQRYVGAYLLATPPVLVLALVAADWTGIPVRHGITLALMLPVLVLMGRFTLGGIAADLGIPGERSAPGEGRVLDALQSYLFTAPVVFHYLRWFLKLGS